MTTRCRALTYSRARYSFAEHGGALGEIELDFDEAIPTGSHLLFGAVEVTTAPTSSGAAQLAVRLEVPGDVLPATAYGEFPAGRHEISFPDAGADTVRTAEEASGVVLTVSGAALTAGQFDVLLAWVEVA